MTYDESKRRLNLGKHAIDLATVDAVFDAPMFTSEDKREGYGEERYASLGWLRGKVVVLVWTERETGAHYISCRKAEKHERQAYRQLANQGA